MIEIQLTTALLLYSVLVALLGLGIWAYTEFAVTRPQQHLGQQFLWKCSFCACTYLDESAGTISQCPRCASYNAADDDSAPHNLPNLPETGQSEGPSNVRASSKRKRRGTRRGPRSRR